MNIECCEENCEMVKQSKEMVMDHMGLMSEVEWQGLAEICLHQLPLNQPLSDEYYYAHLVCCVLDAVFSIGVKYASTRQVPIRYCQHFGLTRLRPYGETQPETNAQEKLSVFVSRLQTQGPAYFAGAVLKNHQRTSSRSGLLKAEAALLFAKTLTSYGIETFQDLHQNGNTPSLEAAIRQIPGQKSGISWRYFWMLAGDEQEVKPDRMILGFLEQKTGRRWNHAEAVGIVQTLCKHPLLAAWKLNPRRLDHAIWNWQRSQV